MPRQLFSHPKSKDWFFCRVVQNVETNKTRIEISIRFFVI